MYWYSWIIHVNKPVCQQRVDGQPEEVRLVKPHLLPEGGEDAPIPMVVPEEATDFIDLPYKPTV